MHRYIRFADLLSSIVGKTFAWTILVMTLGVGYEVIVRYVLNSPTSWALDVSYIMYGTLFMMGGAYTLSQDGHVRGDFLYRLWRPRIQAAVELTLYLLFFFPAVTALTLTGWKYAARSWRYGEVSVNSPAGIPIYQFKMVIVGAGALLLLQGAAQALRCVICLRAGTWPARARDVEETERAALARAEDVRLHHGSEAVDVLRPEPVPRGRRTGARDE